MKDQLNGLGCIFDWDREIGLYLGIFNALFKPSSTVVFQQSNIWFYQHQKQIIR